MNRIEVKICGLKDEAGVQAAIEAKADYVGFVCFPDSPRHASPALMAKLKTLLPADMKTVAVLVDPDDAQLKVLHETVRPDIVQLHGKESPERLKDIRRLMPNTQLIKAFQVSSSDDVAAANRYSDAADLFLFDARPPQIPGMLPGGNGLSFDWAVLKNRDFGKPWFLSGGLSADNVAAAVALSGATKVDVSSSIERAPGVKDAERINAFVKAARNA